ncbi:unnamed protein product [Adineta ricciae]|uniref:Uncharacterized protein n=1 Tax=Adineta ricciae TaxID=249248 RepID=A0A813S957_ADIRI|nr:unnamed protein product [Adineta ricciae]CAF0844730.1 unnamed protein product [Adineta ricciae]
MSTNPPCIKCETTDNFNGLLTCNGCRQSYCSNHIDDHFLERHNRFEQFVNEYNLLYDTFRNVEKRLNGDQREKVQKELSEIKFKFLENQKSPNYCEKDFTSWLDRFERIRNQLTISSESNPATRIHSKGYILYFSCIFGLLLAYYVNECLLIPDKKLIVITGPIRLSENDRVAEHSGDDHVPGTFRVRQNFSDRDYSVRFRIEKISSSNAFIGIAESKDHRTSTMKYGWLIGNDRSVSIKPEENIFIRILRILWQPLTSYQVIHSVQPGDTVEIVVDCAHSKIIFENLQTNLKGELEIDQQQIPLPWQVEITLNQRGDRIRLL